METPTATVLYGPWADKIGPILLQTADEIVLLLEGKDDAGPSKFEVRMPLQMVSLKMKSAT